MNAAGVIETPDDLTAPQAKQLKEDFVRANSGLSKMHLPPVLTAGAKFNPIQISPEQAQFIEQRKFSVDEIARFFRVPPHMIGNLEKTSSWGTGIEQQSIGFVTYTLRPWIERLEEAWSRHMLLFQPNVRIGFNVDGLLRGDHAARSEYYKTRFMTASMSPNDIAKAEGEPPVKGGDVYYFPVNMAPVGTEPLKIAKVVAEDPHPDENLGGDKIVGVSAGAPSN
jgi:HK97 family phage portal protein